VLIGDSITANWQGLTTGRELAGLNVVNRGIPSDDTAHMLARFDSDVIRNRPRVVVILGGINDLVRVPLVSIEQNLEAMAEKAERSNIRVVLATLPPAGRRTDAAVSSHEVGDDKIRVLNDWIRNFAARKHYAVADYYAILADEYGSYLSDLTSDGIHPSMQGYERMEQLLRDTIQATLQGRK
jgi:lysophospholipase L1-like esterase